MFPYLDSIGFKKRTMMPLGEVDYVVQNSPGYLESRIAVRSSYINSRLRKRYGNNHHTSSLPLGQGPPLLDAAGTAPPQVALQGRPVLGSMQLIITITSPGATGVAIFSWSSDGGTTTHTGLLTGTSVSLAGTGLNAVFPAGATFSADNVYSGPTPVPETVLGWLVTFVTWDLYRKRGVNPQDPQVENLKEEVETALAELKEAADSKDGLFDLPANENTDSAISTGGALGYSETSPYIWTDIEEAAGRGQDALAFFPNSGVSHD